MPKRPDRTAKKDRLTTSSDLKDWPVSNEEYPTQASYSYNSQEVWGNGESAFVPKDSISNDGQLKGSEEGDDEPEGSRHSSSKYERKTSSRKKGKSSRSSSWSDWTWSEEHSRYYCYRTKSNGEIEYRWDELQTGQDVEATTNKPGNADKRSSRAVKGAAAELLEAFHDLNTTASPLDQFSNETYYEDTTEPPLDPFSNETYHEDTTEPPLGPFSNEIYNEDTTEPALDPFYAASYNEVIPEEPHRGNVSDTPYNNINNFSSGRIDYVVEGTVNNVLTVATPDNGSDTCILSSSFAARLGLTPKPGTSTFITLANKRQIMSPGMVNVRWSFANESQSYKLSCLIIPGCFSDFILGSHFLQVTKTFTKFKNRIKKIIQQQRHLRLGLIGEGKQYLWGYLDPWSSVALADTGSDVMAVSREFAQKRSMRIDRRPEGRVQVELPDGTILWTRGVVNATWAIGDRDDAKMECSFYVIDNLIEDVVLSKDYLFELDIFSRYSRFFVQSDPADGPAVCGIRLIDKVVWDSEALEREFLADVTSPDAFSREKVAQELARRDQARDRIQRLPDSEQDKATREEEKKKIQWNEAKRIHRARWGT